MSSEKTIWTIGHSTHSLEEFVEWLHSHKIEALVDIRRYPGSRRYPHFNKDTLALSLPANLISYYHFEALGGRRKARPDSVNKVWRHPSFRGYADYMETEEFVETVKHLELIALEKNSALMCSEAVWWSCHRAMLGDYLKVKDWEVLHIMGNDKTTAHPFTKPAQVEDGKLTYKEDTEKD